MSAAGPGDGPVEARSADKASVAHWDGVWTTMPRLALPSSLNVGVLNLKRLLARYVRPGQSVLEIGCAPGKMLALVAARFGARVSGLDYSAPGLEFARTLMAALRIDADLRCEDVFETTFPPGQFDVVYSAGVIEHFDDPRDIVRRHVLLCKPGGVAVITVPNYGGVYGALQRRFDPVNLAIHNTGIMSPAALLQLAPAGLVSSARAFPTGRLSPWVVNFATRWPSALARGLSYSLNAAALLMPLDVPALAPALVLELTRSR